MNPQALPRNRHRLLGAALVFALVAYVLLATVRDPGLTWDEAIYMGDAARLRGWFDEPQNRWNARFIHDSWMPRPDHPPLGRLLIMLSMFQLHEQIGFIAAARVAPILCFALLCAILFLFIEKRYGFAAGILAVPLLAAMPRMFAEAHFASLETPLLLTWTLTLIAFEKSIASRPWSVAAGICFGLALLAKINAVFLFPILAVWGLLCHRRRAVPALLAMALIGPFIFFLGWPALWRDTGEMLGRYIADKRARMDIPVLYLGRVCGAAGLPAQQAGVPPVPWHYSLTMTLVTVPILTLVGAAFGAARIVSGRLNERGPQENEIRDKPTKNARKEQHESSATAETNPAPTPSSPRATGLLLLLAFIVPVGIICLPGMPRYDGVRLFLVAFPPLACLAGIGVGWLWEHAWNNKKKTALRVIAALLALQLLPLVLLHPFQLEYYSECVGGPWGAKQLGFETTYWGDTFDREALRQMRELLPQGGKVAIVGALEADLARQWYMLDGLWPPDIATANLETRDWDLAIVVPRQGWLNAQLPDRARTVLRELEARPPDWTAQLAPVGDLPICLMYKETTKIPSAPPKRPVPKSSRVRP